MKLRVPPPVSAGIILSYKCNSECKHCMYACSPFWKTNWISEDDLKTILSQLSDKIISSPFGSDRVALNYGLHFTGGEPFLNFDILHKAVVMANKLRIPSTFVETNSFWCVSDDATKDQLLQLKNSGMNGILISVNPFILEYVPFERTQRAIKISKEIFGKNTMIYQENFYYQFKEIGIKNTMSFDEYLKKVGIAGLSYIELILMGRAAYKFANLYKMYLAHQFFGESCLDSLTRNWHIHIDNYRNYIAGYCGGISLGDTKDLKTIFEGVDLDEHPILDMLIKDMKKFYEFGVNEFGYKELKLGYTSKCHLCLDIRRHIATQTDKYSELNPRELYFNL